MISCPKNKTNRSASYIEGMIDEIQSNIGRLKQAKERYLQDCKTKDCRGNIVRLYDSTIECERLKLERVKEDLRTAQSKSNSFTSRLYRSCCKMFCK